MKSVVKLRDCGAVLQTAEVAKVLQSKALQQAMRRLNRLEMIK